MVSKSASYKCWTTIGKIPNTLKILYATGNQVCSDAELYQMSSLVTHSIRAYDLEVNCSTLTRTKQYRQKECKTGQHRRCHKTPATINAPSSKKKL